MNAIAQEIDRLPETEKKILVLFYHEMLTFKEIALVLGIDILKVNILHNQAIEYLMTGPHE